MHIHVVTAFPNMFTGPLSESIIKRAIERGLVTITVHDLRKYTLDKHQSIDDYPYGGGPGMILKPEPVFLCIEEIKTRFGLQSPPVILMTPSGQMFCQDLAIELATLETMILLCGHYKGIDERIREHLVTHEISIGDYILTGGELPAMVIIDSVVRLIPGAISDLDSAETDSFHSGLLDHPHYTRPEEFRGWSVPRVLLSGNHDEIKRWQQQKALEQTLARRPDLIETEVRDLT